MGDAGEVELGGIAEIANTRLRRREPPRAAN
jgi:hypothetical protein